MWLCTWLLWFIGVLCFWLDAHLRFIPSLHAACSISMDYKIDLCSYSFVWTSLLTVACKSTWNPCFQRSRSIAYGCRFTIISGCKAALHFVRVSQCVYIVTSIVRSSTTQETQEPNSVWPHSLLQKNVFTWNCFNLEQSLFWNQNIQILL